MPKIPLYQMQSALIKYNSNYNKLLILTLKTEFFLEEPIMEFLKIMTTTTESWTRYQQRKRMASNPLILQSSCSISTYSWLKLSVLICIKCPQLQISPILWIRISIYKAKVVILKQAKLISWLANFFQKIKKCLIPYF